MAFIEKDDIHDLYVESKDEATVWREDYHEYERLADNDLIEDLDENLPETNDGSLAASLFKLPKRIVSSKLTGRAKALDADDAWITELANIRWENEILPNANSQAPFHRKLKDAVRKAAIYGGQPIITLFVEHGEKAGSDIIIPQAQDVILEAGKVSDYDSDIIFWEIYLSKKQLDDMIEQAEAEMAEAAAEKKDYAVRKAEATAAQELDPEAPAFEEEEPQPYNKWYIDELKAIKKARQESDRDANTDHNQRQGKAVKKSGYKFYVAFQRGVDAPFYMYHCDTKKCVREWTNPDPTGDIPVHYLYCYQDFINPYGIGIVKLAGGTQNVLDYMRQADVLATQIGIRPPIEVAGDADTADLDSIVYAQDALWLTGNATVKKQDLANGIYQELPNRISMYKTSLNQLIPTGDTSISASAGDPNYSKTPAGVKYQAANLSIDDEDFKDNFYMTYEVVVKSMINIEFANMQGSDLMKLSDEQRDILSQAGLEFPLDEEGNPTNELDLIWDEARATFDFKVDAEQDKAKDDEKRLEGLLKVTDFIKDPNTQNLIASGQPIILGNKKLDPGELVSEIVLLTTDNKKIIVDITPEDQAAMQASADQQAADQQAMAQQQADQAAMGQQQAPGQPQAQPDATGEITPDEAAANVQAVMQQYGVDQGTAAYALEAERTGLSSLEDALSYAQEKLASEQGAVYA